MTNFLRESNLATALANLKKRLYTLERRFSQSSYATGDVKVSAVDAVPAGWLSCNGADVSRTTYADLFAAIGTTYGAGDGSTTFTLPDARRRSIVGVSATAPVLNIGDNDGNGTGGRLFDHDHSAGTLAVADHALQSNTTTGGASNRASTVAHVVSGRTGSAEIPHIAFRVLIKT